MAHDPQEILKEHSLDIIVYAKSNCVQCDSTIRRLQRAGAPFFAVDLEHDAEAFDYVTNELGHKQAPVVIASIRGRWRDWSGFNPSMLDEAIESATDERYGATERGTDANA